MMKTLSDKAVTNQSHRERRRTVKDISGRWSRTSVRSGRPVTADSRAALQDSSYSCRSLSHPLPPNALSLSFLFVINSSRSWRPDRGTQAALMGADRWRYATGAVTVFVTKKDVRPPNARASPPKSHHSCQHAKMSINTGPLPRPPDSSLFLSVLLFSSNRAAHFSS